MQVALKCETYTSQCEAYVAGATYERRPAQAKRWIIGRDGAVRCYIRIVASGRGKEPHQWRYDLGERVLEAIVAIGKGSISYRIKLDALKNSLD